MVWWYRDMDMPLSGQVRFMGPVGAIIGSAIVRLGGTIGSQAPQKRTKVTSQSSRGKFCGLASLSNIFTFIAAYGKVGWVSII